MNNEDDYKGVELFLQKQGNKYLRVLSDAKIFFDHIRRNILPQHIYHIYSRLDNIRAISEFKAINQITKKAQKLKAASPSKFRYTDLWDIVGISIVVFYDSDIQIVLNTTFNCCTEYDLQTCPFPDGSQSKKLKYDGYHAQHIILKSLRPALKGLKCEVQVKTLLHDVWHAKTHNLTYKPVGYINVKHKALMDSFGEIIQAIEMHSDMTRKLIAQDAVEEEELLLSARIAMTSWLEHQKFNDPIVENNYGKLFSKIQNVTNDLVNYKKYFDERERVDQTIRQVLEELELISDREGGKAACWQISTYLACISRHQHVCEVSKIYLMEWLARSRSKVKICGFKSFVYYMIGERLNAIQEIRKFFESSNNSNNAAHNTLKFNLLYYLIEEASFNDPISFKSECELLVESLKASDFRGVRKTAVSDTLGYYSIVFGQNREEIEKGIRMCQDVFINTRDDKSGDVSFAKAHEKIGWRRYVNTLEGPITPQEIAAFQNQ